MLDRRSFLKAGAFSLLVSPVIAESSTFSTLDERSLSFHNLHTGESLRTVYWSRGEYVRSSLATIDRVLRDHRTGEIHEIHPRLLDLLCDLRLRLDASQPIEIISGYRSPATNAMLHARSDGVASRSLHMDGKAIDLRISGRSLATVRKTALSMKAGGVGYYPASDFVHLDIGRVRSW
jgi:uncharacterized protein YcbK (DUF882 family)